jgi:hypothetical protein
MRPEIQSEIPSDRQSFFLNVSPLDIPKENTVSRTEKDIEDRLRKWQLDLMMANFEPSAS